MCFCLAGFFPCRAFALPVIALSGSCSTRFLLWRVFSLPGYALVGFYLLSFEDIKAFLDKRKRKKRSNFNDLKFVVFCFVYFA